MVFVAALAWTSAQGQAQPADVLESGIGAEVQEMDASLASSFGLNRVAGALVTSVIQGGPAYRAGLQVGDILLSLDDVAVRDSRHLLQLLEAHAPGSIVSAQVWRDPYPVPLKIHLPAGKGHVTSIEKTMPLSSKVAGLLVREMNHADRCRAGVRSGLVVESAEGPAAAAGIRVGAVILGINGAEVSRIDDFYGRLAEREGRVAAVLVRQEGHAHFLSLVVPRK